MKTSTLILTYVICAISSPFVNAVPVIQFSGEVSTATCVPTVNGNANGTVLLSPVLASTLDATGRTTGATTFKIDLPGGCSTATSVIFNGYNVTSGILGNTATTNAATNVGLELLTASGTAIVLSGATTVPITITNGQASFGVQYKALGVATAGLVRGTAEYTVSYR